MDRRGRRLSRRAFVVGAGSTSLGLLAGCGRLPFQQPPPTPVRAARLGYLNTTNPAAQTRNLNLFRQALAELGYVEGENLAIEYRWGEGSLAAITEYAEELIHQPVDVLIVPSVPAARLAQEATTTVPIIMVGAGDLVGGGLAASYARPGGNITGVTNLAAMLSGKRIQLLKEAVPSISRIAVYWDVPSSGFLPESWGRDAQSVGVQLYALEVRDSEGLDAAVESAAREGADALIVPPSPLAIADRPQILQLAARLRWPAMYFQRQYVEEGGLMSYEGSLGEAWRRAAAQVDKILRGAKPAETPIEQAMTFDFVVNLRTARELGITFPNEILLQVTEVIP